MKKLFTTRTIAVTLALSLMLVGGLAFVKQHQAKAAVAGVSSTTPCVGSAAPAAGQWKHVIVLMFENQTYGTISGNANAPYINDLMKKCGSAYSGTTGATPKNNWHDANYKVDGTLEKSYNSKPSYAVLTNGRPASETGIVDDTFSTTTTVDNIYNVMQKAGKTAGDYYDGPASTTPCATSNFTGAYHDAIRYYTNLGGQSTDPKSYCNTHDKPISQFMADVNSGALPAYVMVLPTNCENMHSCSSVSNVISNADTWAKNFLTPLLDSAEYKNGDTAIFFLWDEDTAIPNVLISPSIVPGSKVPAPSGTAPISHYSALRTASEMLGISYVGYSAQAPSLLSFFGTGSTTTPPPPPADTSAPTVALTSPAGGATVSGSTVAVAATASDNVGVTKVELSVNGQLKSTDTTSPYAFSWDTTGLASGTYTLSVRAYDAAGNSTASTANVNFVATTTCSAVSTSLGTATMSISVPSATTYHIWSRMEAPDATNNSYYLQVDNACPVNIGDSSALAANTWSWVNYKDGSANTLANIDLASGNHTVTMIGKEAGVRLDRILFLSDTCIPTGLGDNCTTTTDITAPSVNLTAPAANAALSGTATLSATASDETGGSGMAKVDFYYNGSNLIGSVAKAPYNFAWDTSKVPDGTYAITAKAFDVAGNASTSGSVTVAVKNSGDSVAPSVPQNFGTGVVTFGEVSLSWSSSTDTGGSGLAGYHVYRDGALVNTAKETTFNDTTVTPNTKYSYSVDAYDNAGNKSAQSTISVTTPASSDTTGPTAPTNLTGYTLSSTQVSLAWLASTDSGGSGLAGYYVKRDGVVVSPLLTTAQYVDNSVNAGTVYSYEVIAVDNAKNASTPSNKITITTQSAADTQAPSVPSGLSGLAASSSQIDLSWAASTDAGGSGMAGYNVYRNGTKLNGTLVKNPSYGDGTVQAGQTYQYTVTAVDAAGNESAKSNQVSVSVPSGSTGGIVLSDNFEPGTSNWTPVLGTWSAKSDTTQGTVYHQDAAGDAWSTFGDPNWTNYSVEAKVRPLSFTPPAGGSSFAAVYGRWQDDSHWYYVVLRSTGQLELKRNNANTYTVLASTAMAVTQNTWYKVRLDMDGTQIKVFVNDKQMLTASDSTIASGKIAVGTYYATADFDDVLVTKSSTTAVLNVIASDDAEIRKESPKSNYGSATSMLADNSPVKNFLLKFSVGDIKGRTVTSAKIRLYDINGSPKGGSFYKASSNNWKQSSVTWSSAPATVASPLVTLGEVKKSRYYYVDVTNLVRADGTYSLRVSSSKDDGAGYATREDRTEKHRPVLIITVQ